MTAFRRRPAPPAESNPNGPAQLDLLTHADLSPSTTLTLAGVLAALPDMPRLTLRQQAELASALHTVARLLNEDLAQLPANRRALTRRLARIAPATHGFSKASWSNIIYRLNKALDLVLPPHLRRKRDLPLAPMWQELQARIADQWTRKTLTRFFHFCSETSISPERVEDDVFAQFPCYLEVVRLKPSARVLGNTRRAWNRACQEVPGWPGTPLSIGPRADAYSLSWGALPASLYEDTQGWLARLAIADPFADILDGGGLGGPSKPARAVTLRHREYQIRQFASALVQRGVSPASLTRLADLVYPDMMKIGIQFFLDRHDGKPSAALPGLVGALQAIARHWARASEEDLQQIATWLRRIRSKAPSYGKGMTPKNRGLLRPLVAEQSVLALLCLPLRLAQMAEAAEGHRAALLMQTAVAVEILLMAPLRISNLAALDTTQHLYWLHRHGKSASISFERHEVKNDHPLEHLLPQPSTAMLRRYLDEFRPRLAEFGSTALFPGQLGKAKNPQAFGRQISKAVFEHTGLTLHPHGFRHAMAKIYLERNPGDYETVRLVLGHQSLETTTGTYTGTETVSAMRHFVVTILKAREQALA